MGNCEWCGREIPASTVEVLRHYDRLFCSPDCLDEYDCECGTDDDNFMGYGPPDSDPYDTERPDW